MLYVGRFLAALALGTTLVGAGLPSVASAQSQAQKEQAKTAETAAPASQTKAATPVAEPDSVTENTVTVGGQKIAYRAVAGTITVGSTDAVDAMLGLDGRWLPDTGMTPPDPAKPDEAPAYKTIFGNAVVEICRQNPKVVGITAAMPDGTGLTMLQKEMPERFFDVGIAEQHAVTFAAGLATTGYIPIAAIYSTFLQRAYDQVIHDCAIPKL